MFRFFDEQQSVDDICTMKTTLSKRLDLKIFICLSFILSGFISLGQNQIDLSIPWTEPQSYEINGEEILLPNIEGQAFDGYRPNFFFKSEISGNATSAKLEIITTQPAHRKEMQYLFKHFVEVNELEYDLKINSDGNSNYIVLNLLPFVRVNGDIHRITGIRIKHEKGVLSQQGYQKDFVANSVLQSGSGDWYKITVDKDGIYKIDKSFLSDLGIDVDNLNPQDINIYGNGDGVLPELNSAPRTDDLAKNAIYIEGEGDGVFNDDDYILFYGWGPHRWYANGTTEFYQMRHIYSDVSCYFININPAESPLRIAAISESTDPVTNTVTDYSYYDVHEVDIVSLVNGGQRWYGELFDTELERTFNFNVPDINSSFPAKFEVSLASFLSVSSGTAQTYTVNGTEIFQTTLPSGAEYGRSVSDMEVTNPSSAIPLKISITRNSPDVLTYLDKITLNARRGIKYNNVPFHFSDLNSVGVGNVAQFTISDFPSGGILWEVTDRHNPAIISGTVSGSDLVFNMNTDSLRIFTVSNGNDFYTPERVGQIEHQNLHGLPQADYLIVTHKSFSGQAERLANLHRANGLTVHVVNTEQIFNEFSSGMKDATAIRSFAKMFWDRGAAAPETRPKNLLLFGDGTYDPKSRVPNNNNFVLTYQMLNSENHISAMPSDDYFGILDDSESMSSSDLVDIGVGRLLISDNQMAKEQVDKIEHYMRNGSNLFSATNANCQGDEDGFSSTFGDWRTKYVQIADDEQFGYFVSSDAEPQFNYVRDSFPEMNCEKIYLDAYQQLTTAGGQRYPDVNDAITKKMERGTLLINYVGHGGEVGVAEERVITVPMIQDWRNIDVMPLMVSATCEFTKFDDPDRVSAGEWASINSLGGAIALMTTTRSVFITVNTVLSKEFFKVVFSRDSDYEPLTFGEILRQTKNNTGAGDNKRSFTLIGDPALQLALPRLRVVTDSINGLDPALVMDTISALSKVTIKAHIEDFNGNVLSGFNGVAYPTVFDKQKENKTLSNDGPIDSPEIIFYTQNNRVYSGKASVANGYFEFTFVVPKDINYAIDFGKISYYAENGQTDAIGYDTMFYIGGINPNGLDDNTGPEVDLYLNDENFVNGGITDETPILIAKVFDENGINTVGNGIGHDIVAIIDEETSNPIVLNDFYTADLDSYQSGEIRYPFSTLEPGPHTLSLKVWDVNNNSSEVTLDFVVQEQIEMKLDHVLNYPNPFTTRTEFYFEHNQVCSQLDVQIQIFTVSGRLVKTINQPVHTEGFRSEGIVWDGKDDFGDQLAKGVYVYRLIARTNDEKEAEKLEKLVILK